VRLNEYGEVEEVPDNETIHAVHLFTGTPANIKLLNISQYSKIEMNGKVGRKYCYRHLYMSKPDF